MKRFAAAVALVCMAGAARAETHRYALLIGANQGLREEVVLRYAETDAQRVARVLREMGGFRAEDIVVLASASAGDVKSALASLKQRAATAGTESLLVVFYSGHGDAEALHLSDTRLALDELRAQVADFPSAARVMLIDACRSGALTRVKGGRPTPAFEVHIETPPGPQGLAILTSSAAGEDSQESDQLGASFFTHFLVSALIGAADRNHDGEVTLTEAFAYSSERTIAATALTLAGPQHPTYRIELGGREDVVLTRPASLGRSLGALDFPRPGWYVISAPGGRVVAELQSTDGGRRVTLEAGRYQVVERTTDHLMQGDVEVSAGSVTHVATERLRRVDYARVVRKGGTERTQAWSLFALGGMRGEFLGLGDAWHTDLGARVDLRPVSLELRLGMGRSDHTNLHQDISSTELSVALVGLHVFDVGTLALGVGIEAGPASLLQRFSNPLTPSRNVMGALFGPLATAQHALFDRYYVRLDGAAAIYVFPAGGDPANSAISTSATYFVGAGLGRFF